MIGSNALKLLHFPYFPHPIYPSMCVCIDLSCLAHSRQIANDEPQMNSHAECVLMCTAAVRVPHPLHLAPIGRCNPFSFIAMYPSLSLAPAWLYQRSGRASIEAGNAIDEVEIIHTNHVSVFFVLNDVIVWRECLIICWVCSEHNN